MFVPELGHTLSFVGLPWKVVPFPQAELQAKLIARCVAGVMHCIRVTTLAATQLLLRIVGNCSTCSSFEHCHWLLMIDIQLDSSGWPYSVIWSLARHV
jgi:hypothetical protein